MYYFVASAICTFSFVRSYTYVQVLFFNNPSLMLEVPIEGDVYIHSVTAAICACVNIAIARFCDCC